MIIAAHQPNYLPGLSYFYKMWLVEKFIIITNLQFEKQEGWQQRHKIPGRDKDRWLTVPVRGSQNQLIKDVKINNSINWQRKHYKTLLMSYAGTREKELLSRILSAYDRPWTRLADINIYLINILHDILGLKTEIITDEEINGKKNNLLINICLKHNGTVYLSGTGARQYLTENRLEEICSNKIIHKFINNDINSKYPYSTVHYLLAYGRQWILDLFSLNNQPVI